MPKLFLLFLMFLYNLNIAFAQYLNDSIILFDDFTSKEKFTDLTTKLIWSNSGEIKSGFLINTADDLLGNTKNCLSLTNEAIEKTGYKPGTVKASQAIDYVLDEKLDRINTTYKIEFDALWDELNNNGWGESGRIVVTLLHNYPNEIPFNSIYNLNIEAPFGRPAYNLRIRNHNKTGAYYSGAFMLYGGGNDKEGEIEIYNNEYWLPGFSSEAGGNTPGQMESYPKSPTLKNENLVTVGYNEWKHYTWLLKPERLEFYFRNSTNDDSENELVFFMQIPKTNKAENQIIEEINVAHQSSITQLPTFYNWFRWIEAVRIYFRGGEQTHFANFKLSKVVDASSTGNEEFADLQIKTYPNPCSGYFFIESGRSREFSFSLYNQNGTMVKTGRIQNSAGKTRINVEGLSAGTYVIQYTNHKTTKNQKIIINK